MRWLEVVLGAVMVVGIGCGRGARPKAAKPELGAQTSAEVRSSPAMDAASSGMLAQVGERAGLVLFLRDEGWSQIDEMQKALPGIVPDDPSPAVFAWGVIRGLRIELPREVPVMTHRDPTRPIVLALMQPPYSGPAGFPLGMMSDLGATHPPARHEALVPARDALGLTEELAAAFAEAGEERPELVEGRAGARAFELPVTGPAAAFVALLPEDERVRAVVLERSLGMEPVDLRDHLDVPAAKIFETPAVGAVAEPAPLSAYVRTWEIRSYREWEGALSVGEAIATVDLGSADWGRMRGMAVAAVLPALTPDGEAEFDDWAWTMGPADGGARIRGVGSLTERGRSVYAAAERGRRPAFVLRREVGGEMFGTGDMAGMVAAAGLHELPQDDLQALREDLQVCLGPCTLFGLARWPVAALRSVSSLDASMHQLVASDVSRLHMVLLDSKDPKRWALAVSNEREPAEVRRVLENAVDELSDIEVHQLRHDDETITLIGRRIDPRTLFELEQRGKTSPDLARLRIDAEVLPGSPPIEARLRLAGSALVFEAQLGRGSLPEPSPFPDLAWPSPMGPPVDEPSRCLREAAGKMATGLKEAAFRTIDLAIPSYRKASDDLQPSLACAARSPVLAEAARRLGDAVALVAAQRSVRASAFEQATAILQHRCQVTGGSGTTCGAAASHDGFVMPAAPRVAQVGWCHDPYARNGFFVFYHQGHVLVGETVVPATRTALIEALARRLPLRARAKRAGGAFVLVAEGDTPFSELRPIYDAIAALGGSLSPLVEDQTGTQQVLSMPMRWTATGVSVDWTLPPHYLQPEEPEMEGSISNENAEPEDEHKPLRPSDRMAWSDLVKALATSCEPKRVVVGGG